MKLCWISNPTNRPSFDEIIDHIEELIQRGPSSSPLVTPTSMKSMANNNSPITPSFGKEESKVQTNQSIEPTKEPPTKEPPTKEPPSITKWLTTIGLPQYIPMFLEQEFELERLHALNNEILTLDLGIKLVGHRVRILSSIQDKEHMK